MTLSYPDSAYAMLLFISGGVSLLVSIIACERQKSLGGLPLSLMMISMTIWSLSYAPVWTFPSVWLVHIVGRYGITLGIATSPTFFFMFAAEITHHGHWLSKRYLAYLTIVPIITILIVCITPFNPLYYGEFLPDGITNLHNGGPWFWFNIFYSYGLILASLILLVQFWYTQRLLIYRRQIGVCILGVMILILGNLLDLFNLLPITNLDPTPILFTISGLIFAYSIFGLRMLDVVPVALNELVDQMGDGLIVMDKLNRVIEINQSAIEMIGGERLSLIGMKLDDVLRNVPELRSALDQQGSINHTIRLVKTPSQILDIAFSPLHNPEGEVNSTLMTWRDVTHLTKIEEDLRLANQTLREQIVEIETLQDSLRNQAIHDPLTNLYNRRYLEEIVPKEIQRAARLEMEIIFLMIDIDHFKNVNDTYGHEAGDTVLKKLALCLESSLRKSDLIARLGGEEFLAILIYAHSSNAFQLAEKLRKSIEQTPIDFNNHSISVTVSIGIATYPIHGQNLQELMRNADLALYQAKTTGRNRSCIG